MSGLNEIPKEIMDNLIVMSKNIEVNLSNTLNTTRPITEKHISDYEGKWPIEKQYLKIYEEVAEAEKAYTRNLPNENQELMDVMFSWLTLMHFKKIPREDLQKAILECLIKFHQRGWI